MKPVVVWGGTGQLVVIDEFIKDLGYEIKAVIDNDSSVKAQIEGAQTYHQEEGLNRFLSSYQGEALGFIVAIGGDKGKDRFEISTLLQSYNLYPVKIVHPRAYIARSAKVGEGCQVMANATLGARAVLGRYSLLNTGCVVDHECQLGIGVHIGPGASLAGSVEVGDYSFIGTGAVVLPKLHIGRNSIVGAGSVVTRNVPHNTVCYGNPARVRQK